MPTELSSFFFFFWKVFLKKLDQKLDQEEVISEEQLSAKATNNAKCQTCQFNFSFLCFANVCLGFHSIYCFSGQSSLQGLLSASICMKAVFKKSPKKTTKSSTILIWISPTLQQMSLRWVFLEKDLKRHGEITLKRLPSFWRKPMDLITWFGSNSRKLQRQTFF